MDKWKTLDFNELLANNNFVHTLFQLAKTKQKNATRTAKNNHKRAQERESEYPSDEEQDFTDTSASIGDSESSLTVEDDEDDEDDEDAEDAEDAEDVWAQERSENQAETEEQEE
jgi:hypothetical protein